MFFRNSQAAQARVRAQIQRDTTEEHIESDNYNNIDDTRERFTYTFVKHAFYTPSN